MSLHVASDLTLPDELATQKVAILAMSGAGKSNTAVVLAEELYSAAIPWVAIDPKGDWWGIRAGRDGTPRGGIPIPVFGGLHGDIPLEPTAGRLVGNLIAEQRLTCVLDTSEFDTRQQQYRFLADLGETLLRRNRGPLHLFLEEADEYLPQTAREKGELPRCLGAWLRVVKRGRVRGLGTTLISQRSAAIHKDVLNQADTLIAMRVTAPRDRKAIEEWVVGHSLGKDLVTSLPELEDGEAWVWSPQRLKIMQRVTFRRRSTFDSGATPDLLDAAREARTTLADVDLDALKDQMAETLERADKEDPKKLQARIRDLERELRDARATVPDPERIVETVEVPVFDVVLVERMEATLAGVRAAGLDLADAAEVIAVGLRAAAVTPQPARQVPAPHPRSENVSSPRSAPRRSSTTVSSALDDVTLGKGERTVLGILAEYPEGRTHDELAFLAGYSAKASTLGVILAKLRRADLVEPGQPIRPTAAGLAAVGGPVQRATGQALLDQWLHHPRMGAGERAVLQALIDAHPDELTHDELCARTGYSPSASTIGVILSKLRKLGIVEKGARRVPDEFMDAIR